MILIQPVIMAIGKKSKHFYVPFSVISRTQVLFLPGIKSATATKSGTQPTEPSLTSRFFS